MRLAAVDIGAGSGRVIRGTLEGGKLAVREVLRFPTGSLVREGHLRWDLPRILERVEEGLGAAGSPLDGVGADSFGVDFGLLDERGRLLELPVAYRDARTRGAAERFFERIPFPEVYRRTGIQLLPFNTLYQLFAAAQAGDRALARAHRLLLFPDLILHHLSGACATEWTDATTTSCVSARERTWDRELLEAAGVDPGLFAEIVPPGTILGPLARSLRERLGLGPVPVIAPATHDTAAAVAAVPSSGPDRAFLSLGTWALLGAETPAPVITERARDLGFTNEGGVEGTNRLLTNLSGLWLLQRLREELAPELSFAELERRAAASPPFRSLVNPDDPRFLSPPSMAEAVADSCRETGQPAPDTPGGFARAALESVALRCRTALDRLARVLGRPVEGIHLVGGGARNRLLCRMIASAAGVPVAAGPAEATAVGNLLVTARALGGPGSLAEIREVVRRSFSLRVYDPEDPERWEEVLSTRGRGWDRTGEEA